MSLQGSARIKVRAHAPAAFRLPAPVAAVIAAAALLLGGCSHAPFSQFPGFAELRLARSHTPPTAAERILLERFKPLLFIAEGSEGPIDFYQDYIAHGRLSNGAGTYQTDQPDRAALNRLRADPEAAFTHRPPDNAAARPVAYGGFRRAELRLDDTYSMPITVLSYHFVFRHSGLPRGAPAPLRWLAGLSGADQDWHQLDHYTAAFIVLNEAEQPFAVMLQQHNYLRTYLIGSDPALPANGPIQLDSAIDSNELYPHRSEPALRPAAGFMGAAVADYLAGISAEPPLLFAAPDLTHGQRAVEYTLEFLPPNDAFYVFEGRLGERRWLPGRDGPPGAMYNTLPALHPPETALPLFYWQPPDAEFADLLKDDTGDHGLPSDTALDRMRTRFMMAIAAAQGH